MTGKWVGQHGKARRYNAAITHLVISQASHQAMYRGLCVDRLQISRKNTICSLDMKLVQT